MQHVVMRAVLGDTETGCSTPRENPLREAGHLSLGLWGSDKPFQQKKEDTEHQHPIPCSDTNADLRFLYSNAHTHTTGSGLTGPGSGNPVLIAVIAGTAGVTCHQCLRSGKTWHTNLKWQIMKAGRASARVEMQTKPHGQCLRMLELTWDMC